MTANLAAKKAFQVGGTVLATLLVVLLVLNLSLGDQRVDYRIEHAYDVREPLFQRTMGRVLAPGFVEGNSIETLHNGEEIFPAMLEAVRSARHTITLETYIFYSGETARQFADALVERARAGVQVHVLLDWFGGQINDDVTEADKAKWRGRAVVSRAILEHAAAHEQPHSPQDPGGGRTHRFYRRRRHRRQVARKCAES